MNVSISATSLCLDKYLPVSEIQNICVFPVIGGVLLCLIIYEGGGLTITNVYHIDCDQEEPVVSLQQSLVAESLGIFADLTTLVHCHKVNSEGKSVLVIQDFCSSEQPYIY